MMLDAEPTREAPLDGRGPTPVLAASLTKKPVLIVLHMEGAKSGHVGRWFVENGFPLDIRRPFLGDPLPETLAHHTGAVIFGGGFAFAALCPGTACVAAASGRRDGLAAVGGMFAGTALTPAVWPVVRGAVAESPREPRLGAGLLSTHGT